MQKLIIYACMLLIHFGVLCACDEETRSVEPIGGEPMGGEPMAGEERIISCESYESAATYSELNTEELPELSGLSPSGIYPHVFWSHNDSGHDPILYALHSSGELMATIDFPHPHPDRADLEDIDTAPCPRHPEHPCLWIADTGDNGGSRDDIAIYVIPEPTLNVPTEAPFSEEVERLSLDERELVTLRLEYEEGASDIEALVVEGSGEALWLIEKVEDREARVWRYELDLERIAVDAKPPRQILSAITRFTSPGIPINRGRLVTAADLSPDGLHLALRVYTGVYEYRLPAPNFVSAISLLTPTQVRLGPLTEPQGEALCYDAESNLWSASESDGSIQVLTRQLCIEE